MLSRGADCHDPKVPWLVPASPVIRDKYASCRALGSHEARPSSPTNGMPLLAHPCGSALILRQVYSESCRTGLRESLACSLRHQGKPPSVSEPQMALGRLLSTRPRPIGRVAQMEMAPPVLVRALEPFPAPAWMLNALHVPSIEFLRTRKTRCCDWKPTMGDRPEWRGRSAFLSVKSEEAGASGRSAIPSLAGDPAVVR